jgi:hypothetical protein
MVWARRTGRPALESGESETCTPHVRRLKVGVPSVHPLKASRALRRLKRETDNTEYLFVSERGAVREAGFAKLVEHASWVHVWPAPYMLRHSCAYKLANDGHDALALTQAYLGHNKNIKLFGAPRCHRHASSTSGGTVVSHKAGGLPGQVAAARAITRDATWSYSCDARISDPARLSCSRTANPSSLHSYSSSFRHCLHRHSSVTSQLLTPMTSPPMKHYSPYERYRCVERGGNSRFTRSASAPTTGARTERCA